MTCMFPKENCRLKPSAS